MQFDCRRNTGSHREFVTALTGTPPLFELETSLVPDDDDYGVIVDDYDDEPSASPGRIPPILVPTSKVSPTLPPAPPPVPPPVAPAASSTTAPPLLLSSVPPGADVPGCGEGCRPVGSVTGVCMTGDRESVCIL
eukprot:jgi/Ulvmu1/5450/UM225_0001.1